MKLADLIRGVGISDEGMPATFATDGEMGELTVASAASVAVADVKEPEFLLADRHDVIGWLFWIGERDQVVINEVLDQCEADLLARSYFLARSQEAPKPLSDDRHFCHECSYLDKHGYCLAAMKGLLSDVTKMYRPAQIGLPRRCESFINLNATLIIED